MRGGRAAELVAVLILGFGTWLGLATSGPPRVVPVAVPFTAFSAERAMPDLRTIAARPHPTGSLAHDRLRDFLVDRLRALGADEVHIQSATGFNTLEGPLAATVANVVARKRGTKPGKAILLSAHYDAVPRSFGAGDDGVGVAAILESLRALSSAPPLDHDVIITFVDAEENGLLGAEAFVNLHPWAKDAAVVLNFDGRGTTGPVYMFQASAGNAPLIGALAQVQGARTNSLTGEVYRHLPSDTDLSIWLHSGLAVGALNFAQVDGYQSYHTPLDNMTSLDPRVLQQMGDYALTLTRELDRTDLAALQTTDEIYFNAPLVNVIRYPARWSLILAIDAFALVLVLVGLGWYRRMITLRGVGRGALVLLATLLLPAFVTFAAWTLVTAAHPGFREILQGDPYNSLWYLLATAAATVAIAIAVQARLSGSATPIELAIAPMLLWGIIGLIVAILLPGASYLFAWPLFAAAMAASWWRRDQLAGRPPSAWLAVLAIPSLFLWPPLVRSLETALTANMLPACALLLALAFSLLILPLHLAGGLRRWIVGGAIVVAIIAMIRAEMLAPFSSSRKRPDSISYLIDADAGSGWWVSFDHGVDEWSTRMLGAGRARRAFHQFGFDSLLSSVAAPVHAEPSPVQVLSNVISDGSRRIHLHVARSAPGEALTILVSDSVAIGNVSINGRALQDGTADRYSPQYHVGAGRRLLRYFGVPEDGVDLWFTVAGTGPVTLRVITGVEGLPPSPSGPVSPRPPTIMSKPFVATDMTITERTVKLD